jgi:hypothetical protein
LCILTAEDIQYHKLFKFKTEMEGGKKKERKKSDSLTETSEHQQLW